MEEIKYKQNSGIFKKKTAITNGERNSMGYHSTSGKRGWHIKDMKENHQKKPIGMD